MFIEVPKVPTEDFRKRKGEISESSHEIQKRVQKARDIQHKRLKKL